MDEEGWTQAELARQLGVPKSVVGDRIRLIELDPVWLDLISSGKLQVSHAPAAVRLLAGAERVSEEGRVLMGDYRSKRFMDHGDQIPVDELPRLLRVAFRDFIRETSQTQATAVLSSSYKGPIVQRHNQKFAADPDLWKPIAADKAKRAKERDRSSQSTSPRSQREPHPFDRFDDIPQSKGAASYDYETGKGEIKVYDVHQGWRLEFLGVPSVFLAKVDRSKCTRVYFKHGGGCLVTTDAEAVAAARAAFAEELRKQVEPQIVELVAAIEKNRTRFRITGPGSRALLESVVPWNSPLPMLARALNLAVEGLPAEGANDNKPRSLKISDVDADMLATAYVATLARAVKVVPERDISMALWRKYSNAPLKFPAIKKSEKLTDRVDVGAMRAAVEAGTLEEAAV
jgi:transcriptional regulator with XRE-family HTH domain